jgi:DNA-binding transcriptional ArsR family regulator
MSPADFTSLDATLDRVRGEFLEMPGLRLTQPQAQRLWGLDAPTCGRILAVLVQTGFLRETYDGSFARMLDEPAPRIPLKMPTLSRDLMPMRRANARVS